MPNLVNQLEMERCPHCSVSTPNLVQASNLNTKISPESGNTRAWGIYICQRCGGVVTAWSVHNGGVIVETFPASRSVDEAIPEPARTFLGDAMNSLNAPSASLLVAASAVDAMLKACNLREGSLYNRIDKAIENNLLTKEMGDWAHEVRLDANDQRHADESATPPSTEGAQKSIDFVTALGEILFVLPNRVREGLRKAKP